MENKKAKGLRAKVRETENRHFKVNATIVDKWDIQHASAHRAKPRARAEKTLGNATHVAKQDT